HAVGGFRQRRQFQGVLQALLNAQAGELADGAVDLLQVLGRIVAVDVDGANRDGVLQRARQVGQGLIKRAAQAQQLVGQANLQIGLADLLQALVENRR